MKEGALSTIPGKIYALTNPKQVALEEFIQEHLKKEYIKLSKSLYAAPFFFTVVQKTVLMFGYFAKIEVEQIKKIR